MSRLLEHRFLDTLSLAGEVQVELVWEHVDIRRGDFGKLGQALADGSLPTRRHIEVRCYPTIAMARRAVENLQQNKKSA